MRILVQCFLLFALSVIIYVGAGIVMAKEEKNGSKADTLKKMNLFKGTRWGYDLAKSFTRAQGTVMILRLFGLEEFAEKSDIPVRFLDVQQYHWANKYVAYASQNSIVSGTSPSTFSPELEMTGREFITLTLRALGYTEASPETVAFWAEKSGLLEPSHAVELTTKRRFLRDDMVYVAYRAMTTKLKGKEKTLLQKLVEDDRAVSREAALDSGLYAERGKNVMDEISDSPIFY